MKQEYCLYIVAWLTRLGDEPVWGIYKTEEVSLDEYKMFRDASRTTIRYGLTSDLRMVKLNPEEGEE